MMLTMTVTAVVALFTQLSLGLTAAGTDGQRGLWHGLRHTPVPTLLDATLAELKHGLQHGSFNSTTLVSAYVDRIQEVNGRLHAVTELNPDALDIARQLDQERAQGCIKGPLHGIPILIKNNIGTADLMNNTAGSFSLLSATLPSDATVASKLRAAGAIILGKSNLSQWANFRASNVSNGWSAYGGQTVGAYYPSQDPCGSSSGSGVATSLGLAWAALGTETDGSLICPGQFNNIVSIKPTVGLTSRHFVIPISATQDTVGPMARTVEDAAALLGVIAGADSADNATLANPHAYNTPDYVRAAKSGTLKGKRFGVPRNWINVNSQGDPSAAPLLAAFEASLDVLRTAGASVVDSNFTILNDPSNLQTLSNNEDLVLATEFIAGLASYLASLTKNPLGLTDLEQVRHFTQAFPAEDYPDINTAVWDQALAYNLSASSAPVYAAREQNFGFGATGGIQASIERDRLDAVVLPSAYASTPAAVVGSPVLTVPMGAYPNGTAIVKDERGVLVDVAPGIPFGVAFAGKKWSEEKLVGFAYAYEQRTHWRYRLKPIVRPTTELLGR